MPAFRVKQLLPVTLPLCPLQDLGKHVAVPLAAQQVDVMGAVHPLVRDHYSTPDAILFFESVQILLQRIRIAHVPAEDIHADGDPVPVQKEPHLDDRCQLMFL